MDQGLSHWRDTGPPFRFCPAPLAFAHHRDPNWPQQLREKHGSFKLANAPLKTGQADLSARAGASDPFEFRVPTPTLGRRVSRAPAGPVYEIASPFNSVDGLRPHIAAANFALASAIA